MKRGWLAIKASSEYGRIMNGGRKYVTNEFVCIVSSTTSFENTIKLGVIASKKVGCAVVRNRCKRVLRACFTAAMHSSAVLEMIGLYAVDVVLISRANLISAKYSVLVEKMTDAIIRCLKKNLVNM